jgi:phosphate transport system protein
MANIAHDMIRDALSIFAEFDEEKAKSIWTTDLEVDQLHKDNNKFCQLLVEKDPSMASSVFEVLFISKSLERVCDHAVNISKEIFFIATSRDVRHAPEYKKAALRRDLK